jgi:hypothetical protein
MSAALGQNMFITIPDSYLAYRNNKGKTKYKSKKK